jgi:hypothetical protein
MSTRHANANSTPALERYMSHPAFVERRGIPGNLVHEKASLYHSSKHREMLFFLHAVSLNPGGLRLMAAQIVDEFPYLLGSPTMHSAGVAPGTRYSEPQMEAIREELSLADYNLAKFQAGKVSDDTCVEYLLEACRFKAAGLESGGTDFEPPASWAYGRRRQAPCIGLDELLSEICRNPEIDLVELEGGSAVAGAAYICNLWEALSELKRRAESVVGYVTTIGRSVDDTLDYILRVGRIGIIEGLAGSGKTTAAEAWVRRHPGRARFVTLSGITHRTGFFQRIAKAIGLGTCQQPTCELQAKIETFFATSRLMLVIDEAHHAWPKSKRVTQAPEIIDWINTALVNSGVPVALVCTDQFVRLKAHVEKQTGWTSEQLMHRVKRYTKLAETPTRADLVGVAEHFLSMVWSESTERWEASSLAVDADCVEFLVSYAEKRTVMMLSAVRDAIDEARQQAREVGRERVTIADVIRAVDDYQLPADAALKQVFGSAHVKPLPGRAKVARKSKIFVDRPVATFRDPHADTPQRAAAMPISSRGSSPVMSVHPTG